LPLITILPAAAQNDSIPKENGKVITSKFPTTRVFDVQYNQLGPADYTTKAFGNEQEKAKVNNHYRFRVAANIPVYKTNRFFITGSLRYKYEVFEFDNAYDIPSQTNYDRPTQEFHYFAGTVSATYFSTLFKKPVIYNVSGTVDANQYAFQRVKGLASATFVLKKNDRTTITAGALAMLDPSSILPFVPIFTYEHNFKNSPWTLDFILPQRLLLKRKLLEKGQLSVGTELNSENFYLRLNTGLLNGTYELNQLELRSGLTYEYWLGKNLIGTFKGGITNVITTRITERGEKTSKYILESKQDPQWYFNIGISYNPF